MIASFGDPATEALYHGRKHKGARTFPNDVTRTALRELDMLNAARDLRDLQSPPGHWLERLKGDRDGFFSIRGQRPVAHRVRVA
jgi:proteic killer suppression protein